MERLTRDRYRLSSGREVDANHGLIGIADQRDTKRGYVDPPAHGFELSEGYDGNLAIEGTDWSTDPRPDAWTAAEKIELAEFMIDQWNAFKAAVQKDTCDQVLRGPGLNTTRK